MNHSVVLTSASVFRGKRRTKKAISLTALIDVVFILLMFFMLTSTFIKWHQFELQTSTLADDVVVEKKDMHSQLIIIKQDGTFSLLNKALVANKHEQSFRSVAQLINTLDPKLAVVLIPEAKVQVQGIMASMMELKKSHFTNITLGNALPSKDLSL